MANIAPALAGYMRAQGSPVPISLLELQTLSGQRLYYADAPTTTNAAISAFDVGGPSAVFFEPWVTEPPEWSFTAKLATQTASITIQNLSGDTVQRTNSLAAAAQQLWGAVFVYRLWKAAAEYAFITVSGNVTDVQVGEASLTLTLRDAGNWSDIQAPDCEVSPNCQNQFGSQQCGSTSPTPCQNTYGTCTSLQRFKGVVTSWNPSVVAPGSSVPIAQPVPPVAVNLRRSS